MTTVVTFGTYDLFHVGHLNILRHARGLCDSLVAGVVSDEMALRVKGKAPVVPELERLEIVQHITHVDRAVLEDVPEKLTMWERIPLLMAAQARKDDLEYGRLFDASPVRTN